MQLLNEVLKNPGGLDSLNNYIGQTDFPNECVLLCQNRDSDRLTRSNFTCALGLIGGECENVKIHRFGHWACGYWEALTVIKNSKEYKIALKIEADLANYPVLDDDHYYTLERDEAENFWQSLTLQEKIELCKEYNQSIFSARHEYIPENNMLEEYLSYE